MPSVEATAVVYYQDCGFGVVTVIGIHSMVVKDVSATELGENIEVLGELWYCGSAPLKEPVRPPCYGTAIVLGDSAIAKCNATSDQLCRIVGGAEAWSSGGIPPHLPDWQISRCKAPRCSDDGDSPPF